MGTSELAQQARTTQRSDVWVIEPPIDVERDNPEVDGSAFRRNYGLTDLDFVVVSVSRLALDLKLDALVRAIDAIEMLGSSYPVKLVLVGDGPARGALEERARAVNHRLGRKAVLLVGETLDPRSAYAAADLVVGMGSSALRALAIGRPLVVQGEQAFSEVFEAETRDLFLKQGFYGVSDGSSGVSRLAGQIESLMLDPDRREALGKYGRQQVQERFSLRRAVELQLDIYAEVLSKAHRGNVLDAVRSAHLSLMLELVNHNPYRKRKKKLQTLQLLAAAESGSWPPVISR
jgi:glycosyltransferase involved in cell wall biosynthesis